MDDDKAQFLKVKGQKGDKVDNKATYFFLNDHR
jgi:hypothetical protein